MKAKIISIDGTSKNELKLPAQFDEEIRKDLVKRAVVAIYANSRQKYGADPLAGKKTSAKLSRRRRDYKTAYGIGISRVQRKIMSFRGTRFNWVGALNPNTVGGRRAHPPKSEKKWSQKINKKERRKAIRSALSATVQKDLVTKRGHLITEYPLVAEKNIEQLKKTKDVILLLSKLGLDKEMSRVSSRKVRAGKGKLRGRKYKSKVGPLIVVSEKCPLIDAAKNLPGVDIEIVTKLNADLLAPGADLGRLTIYSESAIEKIEKDRLYN